MKNGKSALEQCTIQNRITNQNMKKQSSFLF
jgi:hypothetical protein